MTTVELDKWAKKIKEMLDENTLEWGLTLKASKKFSLQDLLYLFSYHNISSVKDHRGCISFINY